MCEQVVKRVESCCIGVLMLLGYILLVLGSFLTYVMPCPAPVLWATISLTRNIEDYKIQKVIYILLSIIECIKDFYIISHKDITQG